MAQPGGAHGAAEVDRKEALAKESGPSALFLYLLLLLSKLLFSLNYEERREARTATMLGRTPPLQPAVPRARPALSLSHNRHRQKRVGMKTPKATKIGNMRLLLSEA